MQIRTTRRKDFLRNQIDVILKAAEHFERNIKYGKRFTYDARRAGNFFSYAKSASPLTLFDFMWIDFEFKKLVIISSDETFRPSSTAMTKF